MSTSLQVGVGRDSGSTSQSTKGMFFVVEISYSMMSSPSNKADVKVYVVSSALCLAHVA